MSSGLTTWVKHFTYDISNDRHVSKINSHLMFSFDVKAWAYVPRGIKRDEQTDIHPLQSHKDAAVVL